MRPPKITEREVKEPRQLRDLLNTLLEQQFALLERMQDAEQSLRSGKGTVGGLSADERRLLQSIATGSTEQPVSVRPVVPTVSTLPPTSTATEGEMVRLDSDGIVYVFDASTKDWESVGAAVPSNMLTTNTSQIPDAGVVKTWTAQQVFNGGLTSAAGLTVTAGQFDSASQYGARAYHSAVQGIADSSLVALDLDSESFDRGGLHDLAVNNSRLTIPAGGDGWWLFIAQVGFAASAVGNRMLHIYRNGLGLEAKVEVPNAGASALSLQAAAIVDAAAGDYLEAVVYQNSGGALNTVVNLSVLWGYKLC